MGEVLSSEGLEERLGVEKRARSAHGISVLLWGVVETLQGRQWIPCAQATLLRRLLGIAGLMVGQVVVMVTGNLHVEVRPRWRRPRCGGCGRVGPGYDRKPLRRWRHLGLGRTGVYLGCAPRRVNCRRCGIRTEQVPWAAADSRFTWEFEELVAYLAQITDKTKVTELTGIAWETVGSIVERVVARRLAPDRLHGLRCIGVDEFSYRKRHHYITVVVEDVPSSHRLAAGVLAPGPSAVDDLGGGLVPLDALEHERTADPVATQPHRVGAFFHRRSSVDRESAVAPGQQVVDQLPEILPRATSSRSSSARKSFST